MKLLFENWRKHLNEELLVEVSFEDARENLWKAAQKIVSGYYYDKWGKPPEGSFLATTTRGLRPDFDPKWRDAAIEYEDLMVQTVPNDIDFREATGAIDKKDYRPAALLWLIRLTRSSPDFREEVIERWGIGGRGQTHLRSLIELFFQNQRFMEVTDINKIKSRQELERVVEEARAAIEADQEKKDYLDAEEGTEVLSGKMERNRKTGKLERIPGKGGWFIAIIHNKGAACELGKKSDWCTAHRGLDYLAQYYSPDDPLFYLEDKEDGQRFQFHYGSKQYLAHDNSPVEQEEMFKLHALLAGALGGKIEQYPKVLKQDEAWKTEMLLSDRNSPPEELKNFVDSILASAANSLGDDYGHIIDAARHPNTPPETLTKIIDFDLQREHMPTSQYQLTTHAARNPNTPTDTLDYLANANIEGPGGTSVRFAVASNPSTTSETLQGLARMTDHAANAARKRVNLEERKTFKIKVLNK